MGLVKSQASNGDYNLNPYHFDHFDVSTIDFFVKENQLLDHHSN